MLTIIVADIFLLPVKRGRAGRTPLKTLIQATSDGVNGVNKTEIAWVAEYALIKRLCSHAPRFPQTIHASHSPVKLLLCRDGVGGKEAC